MNNSNNYCTCCGLPIWAIQERLSLEEFNENGYRSWQGHIQYQCDEVSGEFYDTNDLQYCNNCGKELTDEDIHTCWESRGEFWGSPCNEEILVGYTCSKCGHKEDF